jgi:predicted DNA-binding protein (MmcQ/YjbR family)
MGAAARASLRRIRDPERWLRRLCLVLPATVEVAAWGHPNFRAAGRTFAVFETWKGRPCIAIFAEPEEQACLIERFGFFKTPYVGSRGWVSAWVDEPAPFRLIADLARAAHRRALEEMPRRRAPLPGARNVSRARSARPGARRRRTT